MSEQGDSSAPTRTDFVRQRRFLVTLSLTAITYEYLGLSLTKLNLLGNEVILGAPDRLPAVLGIVLAWSLYRYWTHMYELQPWRRYRDVMRLKRADLLRPAVPGRGD